MSKGIPTVDLSTFVKGNAQEREAFVQKLGKAFNEIGFVAVKNHGVPLDLIDRFYDSAKDFFAEDVGIKSKYEVPGGAGQRGYTSFGKEHAKQSNVGDLKEFYQFGQEVEDGDEIKSQYPDNVWVGEKPAFNDAGRSLYQAFEKSGAELLRAIAIYLDLGDDYFDTKIHNGNSILRAIHYPPITHEPESAIRAEQHEDINLITLLVGASAGGLQLLNKEDVWINIQPDEGELVVNVGDMLQRLTNDYLTSTTHRVVNPPRDLWHTPRLSIPFFLHPRATMDLTCLSDCVTEESPINYEPITAGGYLDERLREIGLKK